MSYHEASILKERSLALLNAKRLFNEGNYLAILMFEQAAQPLIKYRLLIKIGHIEPHYIP